MPARTSRRTPTFEASPDLEFEFFLASKLGGMTVEEMRHRMSASEYVSWQIYYARKAQREEAELAKSRR